MKVLAIIPARGGSKGIPKKNIIDLCGKPLIQYTIEAAKKSTRLDKVFLSSDDPEIINKSKELGLYSEYIRPDCLSHDTATTSDVVLDVLLWLKKNENYIPDAIMLLQPTSPLRITEDIDRAIEQFKTEDKKCLVSVHEMVEHPCECVFDIQKDNWQYLGKQNKKATRRQDYLKKYFYINGAIYLVLTEFFNKKKLFIKKKNTSFYIISQERGIDVDDCCDLKRASFLLSEGKY